MCVVGEGTEVTSSWNCIPTLFSQLTLPHHPCKQLFTEAILGTPV